jgi:hypothetical protein
MAFADLKNDFVFRRIFASQPDILRSLLNDLLGRQDEHTSGNRGLLQVQYAFWSYPSFRRTSPRRRVLHIRRGYS